MVLDEQRRREGFTEMPAPSPQKNALLVWLSIILLVLGGGTIAAIYVFKNRRGGALRSSEAKTASIIFAENEKKINITDTPSERLGKIIKTEVVGADIRLGYHRKFILHGNRKHSFPQKVSRSRRQ